jgi:hypothetical protein
MIRNKEDLPAPFGPMTPIFAPIEGERDVGEQFLSGGGTG